MGRGKTAAAPKRPSKPRVSIAEIAPQILQLLPAKQAQVARALDRKPSDGTVRRALQGLAESGAAERNGDGTWERCQELPTFAPAPDFDAESKALHGRTLKALQEQGTWRDHDAELLERYVRRTQDARTFRAAVDEAGAFTSSDSGRVFAHPGIDKERDAMRDIQSLADALVLTPDARKRHGRDGEEDDGDEFEGF